MSPVSGGREVVGRSPLSGQRERENWVRNVWPANFFGFTELIYLPIA